MSETRVVDGLQAMGYSSEDIPSLVKGTLLQVCVHVLAQQLSSVF